jgi:predicted ATPase
MVACDCRKNHEQRRVVLTGGPGAGKTAVLELVRQAFCSHVRVLPEAASIIFGGGFPRENDDPCRRAAQRAIFHVQRELEVVADNHDPAIVLCDRGTIDGLAYWPGNAPEFWSSVNATPEAEFARYAAVIHLRTPSIENGYNHANPIRTESAIVAANVDARLALIWAQHPCRFEIESSANFMDKAASAIAILRRLMPECCRQHEVPVITNSPA